MQQRLNQLGLIAEHIVWTELLQDAHWGRLWPIIVGITEAHADPVRGVYYASMRVQDDWGVFAGPALKMIPRSLRALYELGLEHVNWERLTSALLNYALAVEPGAGLVDIPLSSGGGDSSSRRESARLTTAMVTLVNSKHAETARIKAAKLRETDENFDRLLDEAVAERQQQQLDEHNKADPVMKCHQPDLITA